jgi:Family of unknown function (DUF6220)
VRALRTIHRYWVALLFLAVVVQIGASGYGAFNAADKSDPGPLSEDQFSNGFDFHNFFGYVIFLGAIVLCLVALGARLGRRRLGMTFVLLVLLVVQILLAWGGEGHPVVGIFHPLNAFLILGLTGRLTYEAWWGTRRPEPTTPTA